MSNIREDKGYTYGIGCAMSEMRGTGHFLIATEVGKEVCEATLNEIRFEMERLHNELISEEELQLVKNYMLGQLLKSADGPNAMMDLYLSVRMQQLDYSFYNKAIESIKKIDAERIQELAVKYLQWDNFTIVTAG
jgi:predicted Zn-dependent peptidase